MFWIFKKRKKDNRASRVIQHGWKVIYEKIKKMVDELEKKIIKLKAKQREKKTQKKSPVCMVCINQSKKREEENMTVRREKREKKILEETVRRFQDLKEDLEEELSGKDLELARFEENEAKLQKKIEELQTGPPKVNVIEEKEKLEEMTAMKKEAELMTKENAILISSNRCHKKEIDRLQVELSESKREAFEGLQNEVKLEKIIDGLRSGPPKRNKIGRKKDTSAMERPYESGSLWPPGDHYRPRRKDVERPYESEPLWPKEELLSRMAQFNGLERPPKTGLLWD